VLPPVLSAYSRQERRRQPLASLGRGRDRGAPARSHPRRNGQARSQRRRDARSPGGGIRTKATRPAPGRRRESRVAPTRLGKAVQLAATRPRGDHPSSRGGAPVGPPATPYSPCTARRPAAHRADGGSGGATFGGRRPSAEGGRGTRREHGAGRAGRAAMDERVDTSEFGEILMHPDEARAIFRTELMRQVLKRGVTVEDLQPRMIPALVEANMDAMLTVLAENNH